MEELEDLFKNGKWYHCFKYEGLISKGVYNIEEYLHYYHLDDDYRGRTILDVGCADGYFSLLLKERNASRVCAIDSNKYDGTVAIEAANFNIGAFIGKYQGFAEEYMKFHNVYEKYGLNTSNKLLLMRKLYNLDVEFQTGTIYDLKPYGTFDIVLCNDLLEHLRDPISAIEQLYFATEKKSIITVSSAMKTKNADPALTYQGHTSGGSFYSISEGALVGMCKSAGFREVKIVSRFNMKNKKHWADFGNYHIVAHAYK